MSYTHLITVDELMELQASGAPLLVFDCSADLADRAKSDAMYTGKHIAGAVRADLERDLSATQAKDAVNGGRHPLPKRELLAQWLQGLGMN
ncbi:MAG: sulfurtransferase, partial [Ottowia sp.]|nr:sulfurtransferase [Ottowia sp.]